MELRLTGDQTETSAYFLCWKWDIGLFNALIKTFFIALLLLSLSRLGLMGWQSARVGGIEQWQTILLNGFRIDLSSVCYLLIPPFLLSTLALFIRPLHKIAKTLVTVWLTAMVGFLLYMEVVTPTFILEYDLRPNRLFVEYLIYPKEVLSMLWTGYKLEILISTLMLVLCVTLTWKGLRRQFIAPSTLSWPVKLLTVLTFLCLLFAGARGSVGHRPINPAMVSFSNDHLLNDLTLNSAYSVIFALLQMGSEKSASDFYGHMPESDVIRQVRQASMHGFNDFQQDQQPSSTYLSASYTGKPKNLVILLQESLGARYVKELGGLPLSPNLDKLMRQGWNFRNLYATGTRSVRGIEAIVTGFTPTPSRAVVKLDKSQQNFFTLADFLGKQGYKTQFIYGGESHFDNMKSFFLGNGFQDIVDQDVFEKVDFEGSWGASDEDLYDQAHVEFTELHRQQQPFFSLVFTSSNHSPYEFPDGKIKLYDSDKATRNNAAKYADYALGRFIEKARKSDYWKDTIFMVVADHDSRVAGASLVPVPHFQIPGVILGENITPRQDRRLVSQIDLGPTLLSLIGVSGNTPMLGHDLNHAVPEEKQRVLMQYDKNFAYMTPGGITVLQPGKPAIAFHYHQGEFDEMPMPAGWAERAKAHVLFGSLAYQKGWYR